MPKHTIYILSLSPNHSVSPPALYLRGFPPGSPIPRPHLKKAINLICDGLVPSSLYLHTVPQPEVLKSSLTETFVGFHIES